MTQFSPILTNIKPVNATKFPALTSAFDADILEQLSQVGVHIDQGTLYAMMDAAAKATESARNQGFGMDAFVSSLTTASITTPVQFLQAWLPGFVNVIMQARKIDELIGVATVGSWEDEEVVQGFKEYTGTAIPYADYGNIPLSSWNTNFERRTIVRFEQGLQVAKLEEARTARIRVNSADSKRQSAALQLEIQRNYVGFYGFNSGANRTYGLLNDPSLPAYVTVAATGTGSTTTWSTKDFAAITADIRTAVAALQNQSGDNINPEEVATTLAVATVDYAYLSVTPTQYGGTSVREWISKTYPKMRVVSVPQFNAANGGANVFFLYADSVQDGDSTDDGATFLQMVPTKFYTLGVEQRAKGYVEDFTNATAGTMLKRPYAVVCYSGI